MTKTKCQFCFSQDGRKMHTTVCKRCATLERTQVGTVLESSSIDTCTCIFTTKSPRGLTFTWWGCYGSCFRHKPTQLAKLLFFCSCVCFCFMALSTVFYSINYPDNSPLSHSVFFSSWCTLLVFSIYISL